MGLNTGYSYRETVAVGGLSLLDHFLAHHRHSSEAEWRIRLERGEVTVDGVLGTSDTPLRKGQAVVWQRPPWVEPEVDTRLQILHEDAALLAVVKPRGLPTLPGGGFLANTLLAVVRAAFPEAHPMHRLGRETSGIVLFSRTPEAGSALQSAWREQRVEKRYRALGSGIASEEQLEITAPIGPVPHPLLGTLHAASPSGKPSRSHARVLERRKDSTLFQVDIDTGRPHQIRIHLAFAGHPLVGDPLYGPGGIPRTDLQALPGDGGYFLHAERLAFPHPTSGDRLELRAEPPEELKMAGELIQV